jgi:tetratricopeptide (TPR) repeat protein
MRRRVRMVLGAALAVGWVACSLGCSGGDQSVAGPDASSSAACAPCSCAPAAVAVVDPSLMAFLSKARAVHHQADLGEKAGEIRRAIAALEQLTTGPVPGADNPGPEVREVMADTYARLAELRSGLGDFDAALGDVQRGLGLALDPTHFRGRLMEVRGLVEERHAKGLEDKGDAKGALEAKDRALAAYEQAVEIQDEVIARTLGDAGAPPATDGGGARQRSVDAGPKP